MQLPYPKIILKKGKERSLLNFHPWIFSGAVQSQAAELTEGSLADVFSSDGNFVAAGHFHQGSIVLRVLSFEPCIIDQEFFNKKIFKAFEIRKNMGLTGNGNTVFRLVYAEGDHLPGLIIDVYNNTAVIQAHTMGMYRSMQLIKTALLQIPDLNIKAIFDKSADTLSKQTDMIIKNQYLLGSREDNIVVENGIKFSVDWEEGQKTGFFIDQRENRQLLKRYAKGKKILNAFCYSGGFSLYALHAGAALVHSVDSSKKAIDQANRNAALNFANAPHISFVSDVADFLKKTADNYDVIILDPPAFAKHPDAAERAVAGYRNLNYEAIRRINKDGIIFTFSCSQAVDKELFRKIIFMAAVQAKRKVRILHQLTQAPDHPVNIYHPQGEYLKGLVLFVE